MRIFSTFLQIIFLGISSLVAKEARSDHVQMLLNTIPDDEKIFLEKCFGQLFTKEFGYTLVGAKPISLCDFDSPELPKNIAKIEKLLQYLIFLFKDSPSFVLAYPKVREDYFELALVNIKAVHKVFKEEEEWFTHNTKYRSAQEIISKAKNIQECTRELFDNNSISTGILLGYGRSNAELFVRRSYIGDDLMRYEFAPIAPMVPWGISTPLIQKWLLEKCQLNTPYAIEKIEPCPPFQSLQEEWDWIAQVVPPFKDPDVIPYLITMPQFVSKPSTETDRINHKLQTGKIKLGNILGNGNYLESVLQCVHQ